MCAKVTDLTSLMDVLAYLILNVSSHISSHQNALRWLPLVSIDRNNLYLLDDHTNQLPFDGPGEDGLTFSVIQNSEYADPGTHEACMHHC